MNTLAHRLVFASMMLVCVLGSTGSAQSASLNVAPVIIEIDSPRKAAAVTVTNGTGRTVTYQAEALIWRQKNGGDHYESTDELVVVPPIFEIGPNSSQVVRVMLRVPTPADVERTYRVMLEDITQASLDEKTEVKFRFSHNLPVLIAPSGPVNNAVQWLPCATGTSPAAQSASATEICVRIRNTGNRRIKVTELLMAGNGWEQSLPVHGGFNILAGAEREWRAPRRANHTGLLQRVQVRTAESGTLAATAAQP